jgi:dihydroxyacetone kinase-like predicted kinase
VAALEDDAFGYETVFILSAAEGTTLDVPAIQARLEAIGNSVLVGGDGQMVKVHVHNERPDEAIAYGLSLGTLTRITVENLDMMADDVREARATEFVAGEAPAAPGSARSGPRAPSPGTTRKRASGAVSVAARPVGDVATKKVRRLLKLQLPYESSSVAWSPNSRQLLVVWRPPPHSSCPTGLWRVPIDGAKPRLVHGC